MFATSYNTFISPIKEEKLLQQESFMDETSGYTRSFCKMLKVHLFQSIQDTEVEEYMTSALPTLIIYILSITTVYQVFSHLSFSPWNHMIKQESSELLL